jgi:hypothetical protein
VRQHDIRGALCGVEKLIAVIIIKRPLSRSSWDFPLLPS